MDELGDIEGYKKLLIERIGEEKLRERIAKKRSEFSGLINEEAAIYLIAKELGILKEVSREIKISELKEGMREITVVGKVERIFPAKSFEREGKVRKVGRLIISQEESETALVLWDSFVEKIDNCEIERGDKIKLAKGYVRNGELNVSQNGDIAIVEKKIVTKISELVDRVVDVYGVVVEVGELREFQKDEKKTRLFSCIISDETGTARCLFWNENAEFANIISVGDVIKIEEGVCQNREIHTRKKSRIIINPPAHYMFTPVGDLKEGVIARIKIKVVEAKKINGKYEIIGRDEVGDSTKCVVDSEKIESAEIKEALILTGILKEGVFHVSEIRK